MGSILPPLRGWILEGLGPLFSLEFSSQAHSSLLEVSVNARSRGARGGKQIPPFASIGM